MMPQPPVSPMGQPGPLSPLTHGATRPQFTATSLAATPGMSSFHSPGPATLGVLSNMEGVTNTKPLTISINHTGLPGSFPVKSEPADDSCEMGEYYSLLL